MGGTLAAPLSHRRPASLNWSRVDTALLFCVPPLFGMLALALGQDANWDLRNYHYYNAWAFLEGRLGWDILPAQTPSFYNPSLDLPFFVLTQHLSARAVGFLLGTLQGVNFVPLYLLARGLLVLPERRLRAAGFGLALAGMFGAQSVSEYGTVFHDNLVSLGFVSACAIVVCHWERLWKPGGAWAGPAVLAGLAAGLAFGLKQSTVLFAVAGCAAFLAGPGPWRRRVALAFVFGISVLAGFVVTGGHWTLHLWEAYGNPLFPYYNQLFESPWAQPRDYRDGGFLPARFDLVEVLTFSWRFSLDSRLVAEVPFRDFRILACSVLLPVIALAAGLRRVVRRPLPAPLTVRGPSRYLMVSAAVAYGLWLYMFRIYRYLIPLEMLAPVLIVAAVGMLPGSRRTRSTLAAAVMAALLVTVEPADWERAAWSARAVEVDLPDIADPAHTLVLMAGHEPLAYLLTAFPPALRFVRIDSNFTSLHEPDVAFNPLMQRIVVKHDGPIAVLYAAHEDADVRRKLAEYRLALEAGGCQQVQANITPPKVRYLYCPVSRTALPVSLVEDGAEWRS